MNGIVGAILGTTLSAIAHFERKCVSAKFASMAKLGNRPDLAE